jgi:hypothetical protein
MTRNTLAVTLLLLAYGWAPARAQQATRPPDAQPATPPDRYPVWLANSYFAFNVGWLGQSFTTRQLEPGFQASSIDTPRVAARVILFGHEFTPYLAAQLTYMRPVKFVEYRDLNGDAVGHSVWTGFGGASLKARAPLGGRTSVYGEAGLGIASRHGFNLNGVPAVRDASHASVLLGAGVEYRLRPSWDLTAGATLIPANSSDHESSALMIDGGVRYTIRQPAAGRSAAAAQAGAAAAPFRPNLLQVEYTAGYGYSIVRFLSTSVPIFWNGIVQVDRGVAVHYDRTVFHTARLFAIDAGTSVGVWRTRLDRQDFYTFSVYPRFTFTPIRTRAADAYFCYSLAGPTFISSRTLDEADLGGQFTFQDFLGGGVVLGAAKRIVLGVKLNHYSNGNLFPENAAVAVPVTFTFGWAF